MLRDQCVKEQTLWIFTFIIGNWWLSVFLLKLPSFFSLEIWDSVVVLFAGICGGCYWFMTNIFRKCLGEVFKKISENKTTNEFLRDREWVLLQNILTYSLLQSVISDLTVSLGTFKFRLKTELYSRAFRQWHVIIPHSYEAERWSVPAPLCWWCCYCLADQLWVLIAYARRRRRIPHFIYIVNDLTCKCALQPSS